MSQRPTRREMLGFAAATTGVAWLGSTARPLLASEAFGAWPIGIQSYTFRKFDVPTAIRHVQGLGLRNIEMFSGHFALDSSSDQIREMLATLNRGPSFSRGLMVTMKAMWLTSTSVRTVLPMATSPSRWAMVRTGRT